MAVYVVKKKSGIRYRADVWKNRRRITKIFRRKVDAELWERAQLVRVHQDASWKPAKEIGFQDFSSEWFNRYAKIRKTESAQKRDEIEIRLRLIPHFGNTPLREITTNSVDEFVAIHISKGKLSRKSVNIVLSLLKKMLNDAVRWDYIEMNPANRVEPVKVNPSLVSYWDQEEIQRFLSVARESRFYAVYLLALNTGMRLGEIVALKWDRVNLDSATITVSRSYCMVAKKIRDTTKGNRIRQVPISDPLLIELRRLRNCSKSDLVFSSSDGYSINGIELGKRDLRRIAKKAQVRPIRFHDLRHTYASQFVMKGGDLFQLKELLGHSDIKTTLRYAHLSPKHLLNSARSVIAFGAEEVSEVGSNVISFQHARAQFAPARISKNSTA